jgi:hypothetical protein
MAGGTIPGAGDAVPIAAAQVRDVLAVAKRAVEASRTTPSGPKNPAQGVA